MPNYLPNHDAPNFRKHISQVLFHNKRALLMNRSEWEEAIKDESGEFLIDPAITPMSNVQKQCEVVGCIVENLGSDIYSLDIYRFDHHDAKPINKDKYWIHTAFEKRPDLQENVPSSTDYNDNMKNFFEETVIIEIRPKSDDHHLEIEQLPDLLKWKVQQ